MNKQITENPYLNHQGYLEKLSNSYLLGYQKRFWKIINDGKQIAYRSQKQTEFKEKNTFNLADVQVQENEDQNILQLVTKERRYYLRAQDVPARNRWMIAITSLKKELKKKKIIKQKKTSTQISHATIQNMNESLKKTQLNMTINTQEKQHSQKKQASKQKTGISTQRTDKISLLSDNPESTTKIAKQRSKPPRPKQQQKQTTKAQTEAMSSINFAQQNIPVDSSKILLKKPNQSLHERLIFLQQFQYSDYFQKLPQHFLLNNIFQIKLQGKYANGDGFLNMVKPQLLNNSYTFTFLLFSSKTLYHPYFSYDNLLTVMLPPWCQTDAVYRVLEKNQEGKFQVMKIFNIADLLEILQGKDRLSIRVNLGEQIIQYSCSTIEEKLILTKVLQIAKINAVQTTIKQLKRQSSYIMKNASTRSSLAKKVKKSKRNYDKIIYFYGKFKEQQKIKNEHKYRDFINKQLQLICELNHIHFDQGRQLSHFHSCFQAIRPFLNQLFIIFQNKVNKTKNQVLRYILTFINGLVKQLIKITWDTLHGEVKGKQILDIMRQMTQYRDSIKQYLQDEQFKQGLKELSKIFVRESWKNFETTIANIVQQQKNFVVNEQILDEKMRESQRQWKYSEEPPQTYGPTDLFKNIYGLFNLAAQPWKHKIHMHNVNRLIQRILITYINELKATIDDQFLSPVVLAAIANNYFRLSELMSDFYNQKFEDILKDSTKTYYDKIITCYRELTKIIVYKIAKESLKPIEKFINESKFIDFSMQNFYRIISIENKKIVRYLHRAFVRKYHQQIIQSINYQIIKSLSLQEQPNKNDKKKDKSFKPPKTKKQQEKLPISIINQQINKIVKKLQQIKIDLIDIFQTISPQQISQRHFCQITDACTLLTAASEVTDHQTIRKNKLLKNQNALKYVESKYELIINIIMSSSQPLREYLLKILQLRVDYYEQSDLCFLINKKLGKDHRQSIQQIQSINFLQIQNPNQRSLNTHKGRKYSENLKLQDFRNSLTKSYIQEGSIISKNSRERRMPEKSEIGSQGGASIITNHNGIKLISQGYLIKPKLNKKLWETLYFRLKTGIFYIYSDERSENCLNSISMEQIISVTIPKPEKKNILITYETLHRHKQMKLKCQTIELRDRWFWSIQLQRKRVKNQQQIKKRTMKDRVSINENKTKRNQLIIDYEQLFNGKGYFSYNS